MGDDRAAAGTTPAVVLAAGGGSRFGGTTHKLLVKLGGRTVVERAVAAAVEAEIGPVVVVTGAVELPPIEGATTIRNPRWADGITTSLHLGLDSLAGHDAAVVGLGDQPGIPPEAWRRVAAATSAPIAVATYNGTRANPVRLAASVWPLLPNGGDEGAHALMRRRPDLVTEVPCLGRGADIDTLEDLERWST